MSAPKSVFSIILMLILLSWSQLGKSAHIVGGDVTYTCMGLDTIFNNDGTINRIRASLEINFTMYRDSRGGGANFDGPQNTAFGVYIGDNAAGEWSFFDIVRGINFQDREEIPAMEEDDCVTFPDNVGVESAIYSFRIVVPVDGSDVLVSYQRCCRNQTINNLVNPGETGAAFELLITSQALTSCNNSPDFVNFPPIFICAGQDLVFDHSAIDPEADRLRYSFCAPHTSGGTDGTNGFGDQFSCTGVRPAPDRCPPPYDDVVFFATIFFSKSAGWKSNDYD